LSKKTGFENPVLLNGSSSPGKRPKYVAFGKSRKTKATNQACQGETMEEKNIRGGVVQIDFKLEEKRNSIQGHREGIVCPRIGDSCDLSQAPKVLKTKRPKA